MTQKPDAWRTFGGHLWTREIDVRDFIIANVTPYSGSADFLAKPTARALGQFREAGCRGR